ncbi:uncharacterized protein LOC126320749 [Schistocerca gregaria]|uniref:uncharacterized protein LOC126320749 n=1 Tax=Schistocerca gregaria TaxID=7010 RepID=UPI00211EEC5D|nr:uncharacterized protein LOC126320749 [Schistocerca gregaria]
MTRTQDLPNLVIVHPLVLLSAVDHFNRLSTNSTQRVVGVLLGSVSKGTVDVTNSYAVPFEEEKPNSSIFFLDQNYHENMWSMFKKVSAREKVVGWYSTGPKIRPSDLYINELFRQYTPNPVFVIIDAQLIEVGIPTKAYVSVEEALENGKTANRFQHIASIIEALEAEEVGVEHLLRDVKDTNISALATQINNKVSALKSLIVRIGEMHAYLNDVVSGKLTANHTIINQIQEIFNLVPNTAQGYMIKAFNVQINDNMLVIYISSLIRAIISLHNLINNKLDYKRSEERENEPAKKKSDGTDAKLDGDRRKKDA